MSLTSSTVNFESQQQKQQQHQQQAQIQPYSNIIYKGWILTYQDLSTDMAGDLSTSSLTDNQKWVPKFAVINKLDKCVLLYDYEPSNDMLSSAFQLIQSIHTRTNTSQNDLESLSSIDNCNNSIYNEIYYRLDGSVNQELFMNYWKHRLSRFDLNQIDKWYKHDDNYFLNQTTSTSYYLNHLSNKDIELLDNNSLSKGSNITDTQTTSTSSSTPGTFRFAGLFFKKDKTDKVKHSSLKRAKSGIQLERKKPVNNNTNNLNDTTNTSKSTNLNSINHQNNMNDFENRHSLPSPMRPSRSHESLSSPLKPSNTINSNMEQNDLKKNSHFNRINQFLASSRSKQAQTPSLKSKSNNNSNNSVQYHIIDNIIKLNLNSTNTSSSNTSTTTSNNSNNNDPSCTNSNAASTPSKSPKPISNNLTNSSSYQVYVNSIHNSLFNEENCFEIKSLTNSITIVNPINKSRILEKSDSSEHDDLAYEQDDLQDDDYYKASSHDSTSNINRASRRDRSELSPKLKYQYSTLAYIPRYFMCRSSEERDKWIQCLRDVAHPNLLSHRHDENSLQVWILEAKGQAISSKPNKKYFCEIFLNNTLYARSCSKDKKDILFWGESFDFNNVQGEFLRVELYQHTIETQKKKSKKEKDKEKESSSGSSSARDKDSSNGKEYVTTHPANQTLLGFINIPVNTIESSQPIEKWYKLESPSSISTSIALSDQSNYITSIQPDSVSTMSTSVSNSVNSSSSATTQNFSKDSISIRIKAKYLSVDILPLSCYQRLIEFIRGKYLNLITLEPYLNVRIKDDLANSLVRIAHKLQIQTKFLTDLVLAEVLQLEDNSLTFRGNSLATKAMESYMKLVGEHYLKLTLSDCVRSIIETNHDLEIDPSKVSNQSSLQANREELVQILHLVCGRVFNSCINFPIEMKHVFSCLRTECKKNGKTDEMCDTLISASIFLRFICPAILSPNLFNLTQEYPQEKAARKLTLAAKTLQTIANFSKFGGKEFYMSFDKMNQFVEEHTVLMREFLRSISTLTEEEEFDLNNRQNVASSSSLTSSSSNKQILPILTLTPQTPKSSRSNRKQSILLNHNETNFDLELIDLGKQLSILHTLLTSISAGLDDQTKSKFDNELSDILNEITNLKKNPILLNDTCSQVQTNPIKLYSYENRLHFAIMKNQQNQTQHHQLPIQQSQQSNSPVTPSTPSESTPSSINSSSELNQVSNVQNSSSSSSSRYSSQITLNILNNLNENSNNINNNNNNKISSTPTQPKSLESEINLLKQKLRETELSLKKEQTEKYLIEYKLKQQQQDNDHQMRNIINRLIKVEEELRKEQAEMHKLLKAKQDLIEIQKKRIEYLSNRSLSGNNNSSSNKSTQHTNHNLNNNNNNSNNQTSNLPQNHPSTNYNQHLYQPKLRQLNKTQLKSQSNNLVQTPMHSSLSNPIINDNNTNQSVSTQPAQATISKLNDKVQIAASPSSSSSSMTQFCSYLAANSKISPTHLPGQQHITSSTQSINNKTNKNSAKSSNSLLLDQQVLSSSSSTSSNVSSLNLNSANQASANFLRASEL